MECTGVGFQRTRAATPACERALWLVQRAQCQARRLAQPCLQCVVELSWVQASSMGKPVSGYELPAPPARHNIMQLQRTYLRGAKGNAQQLQVPAATEGHCEVRA